MRIWPLIYARPDQSDSISSVAVSPNGQRIATASWDRSVTVWNTQDGRMIFDLQAHNESVMFVTFSPDGDWLASSSHDETVRLWNMQTGECEVILHPPGPYADMDITGVTGISDAQKDALRALGAIDLERHQTHRAGQGQTAVHH